MGLIYLLTFPNGKKYVGQTKGTMERRLAQHKNNAQQHRKNELLYNAWRKHGMPQVLILAELPIAELNEAERSMITALATLEPNGYNLTSGGDSAPGIRSVQSRMRTSLALKGKLKGRSLSPTHKRIAVRALANAIKAAALPESRAKATASRKATLEKQRIHKICPACSTLFSVPPSQQSKTYCSPKCKHHSPKYRTRLKVRVNSTCRACGTSFSIYPSEVGKKNNCPLHSGRRTIGLDATIKASIPRKPRPRKIELTCLLCLKSFSVAPSELRHNGPNKPRKFCSLTCSRLGKQHNGGRPKAVPKFHPKSLKTG